MFAMADPIIPTIYIAAVLCLLGTVTSAASLQNNASSPSCPPGFDQHGESCYKFVNDKRTHQQAAKVCADMESYLAEPRTAQSHEAIKRIVKDNDNQDVWLGASDLNNEGVFVWASLGDTVVDNTAVTHWAKKQPNNYKNKQHCLEFMVSKYGTGWNDEECTLTQTFICEFNMTGIEPCSTNQCANGGVCRNVTGSVQCDCDVTGYTGDTCQDDIDECVTNNPCGDSQICHNLPGSVECKSVDIRKILEKLESLERYQDALTSELNHTKAELADATNKLTDTTNELTATNSKLTDTTNRLTATNSKLAETQNKLTATDSKLTRTTTQLTQTSAILTNKITATNSNLARTTTTLNNKLTATNSNLARTTTTLTQANSKLNKAINDISQTKRNLQLLSTKQTSSSSIISQLTNKQNKRVMFTATLSGSQQYTTGQVVKFNKVRSSVGMGNAYNTQTGVFTVPVSGYYFTSVNVLSQKDKDVYLEIKYKNQCIADVYSTGPGFGNAGNSAVFYLPKGQTIKVTAWRNSYLAGDGEHAYVNTFSVHLVSMA